MEYKPVEKYQTVIVDTINQLQNNLYLKLLKDKGKASFDDWKDYGIEILDLYEFIKNLPDTTLIQVLGFEGTGKSFGTKFLDPSETMYFNIDNKPLTWFGARKMYPVNNSLNNYSVPTTYDKVKSNIMHAHSKRKNHLIVFMIGHIEVFKDAETLAHRHRLLVLGKMATKFNINGATSHTYYTQIDSTLPKEAGRYSFTTENSGFNTCRSPEGYWEGKIDNNYQLIVDKILEDLN